MFSTSAINKVISLLSSENKEGVARMEIPEWKEILDFCEKNYLLAFIHNRLQYLNIPIPSEIADDWNQKLKKVLLKNLKIRAVFLQLVGLLQENGIDFIVLKGCDVQQRIYPEPSLRNMIDIDLLLQVNDVKKTEDLLLKKGGKKVEVSESTFIDSLKHHEAPIIFNGVAVELHKTLTDTYDASKLDSINLWNFTTNYKIDKFQIKALIPELLIIYLCHHLHSTFQGGKIKLFWFVDIYQFFNAFPNNLKQEALFQLLEQTNEWPIFSKTLARTKLIFPSLKIPDYLELQHEFVDKTEIIQALCAEKVTKPLPHYAEKFFLIKGRKNKLHFLLEKFFPSKKYIQLKYRPLNMVQFSRYYIYHVFSIFSQSVKALILYIYIKIVKS